MPETVCINVKSVSGAKPKQPRRRGAWGRLPGGATGHGDLPGHKRGAGCCKRAAQRQRQWRARTGTPSACRLVPGDEMLADALCCNYFLAPEQYEEVPDEITVREARVGRMC